MHHEPERARERVHVGVDVEAFHLQALLARRHEEGTDIAPDLERRAAATEHAPQLTGLDADGWQLRVVQRLHHVGCERLPSVEVVQLALAFYRIAVHEAAAVALDEPERGVLGERQAVHQPFRGRSEPQTPLVVRPERFDLGVHVFGLGQHAGIRVAANDAVGELVRWTRHPGYPCRVGAG